MQIIEKKNQICLLFVAFLLLKGTCMYAQRVFIDSVYYTLDTTAMTAQIAVQSKTTAIGDIVINDTVTYKGANYAITSMANAAFSGCNQLTSIVLPQTLRNLGREAFLQCTNLTSCIIPDSTITEIPFEAFWKAGLIEFRVPEGVTYIEQRSFEQMPNLQRVQLANSVKSVSPWAFYILDALQEPIYNDSMFVLMPMKYKGVYTIPSGIQAICNRAFYGCGNITKLTISEGVKYIGYLALNFTTNAVIKSLSFPASLEHIEFGAISGGRINSITVAQGNRHYTSWNGMLFTINMDTVVYCPSALQISCTLPQSVQHIAYEAFCASSMYDLQMPSVKTIGKYAFHGNSLGAFYDNRAYVLPDSLEKIDDEAFFHSYQMEQITIPASVDTVGTEVFAASWELRKAIVNNRIIGKGQFRNCAKLEMLEIGTNLQTIGEYAFGQCPNIWYVRMPKANAYFRVIDGVLYSADTTALALYPPKHDGEDIIIPDQVTTLLSGSLRAVNKNKLILPKNISLLEKEVFGGYMSGYNDNTPSIDTIVAPMMSVPAAQSNSFNLLNQAQTVLLVPCDSLADIYRANSIWNGFNIQVDSTLLELPEKEPEVETQTDNHSVQFTWPSVEGASYYTLIIWANEERTEKICTLTFNSTGQLVEIDFSKHAPARLAMTSTNTFSFRYNGLDENTNYWFTMTASEENDTELFYASGSFATLGANTPTDMEDVQRDDVPCTKVLRNGQIIIRRGDAEYTIQGNQVK